MDWFLSLVRIAGSSFPGAASLAQLQSELDTKEVRRRITALEDPIGQLHPQVPALGALLYQEIATTGRSKIRLAEEAYRQFSRPLAVLEAAKLVTGGHALGRRYADGLVVTDPVFVVYLARAFGDSGALERLITAVDQCRTDQWLKGEELVEEHGLPQPVVNAVFRVYEARGYGITSKTIGESLYRAMA
jgi:hypothetical protein